MLTQRALDFAALAHTGQMYGTQPYIAHLIEVTDVLQEFVPHAEESMRAAAWLHDAVEDTSVTLVDVRNEFGLHVADLVDAVTTEPGKNRKERNALTYPKIHRTPGAVTLKLADRIANVRSCWRTQDAKLFMYQREYRDFRVALRIPEDLQTRPMWDELDRLLGWWEPK